MTEAWSDIPQRAQRDICANCYEPFPQDQLEKVRGVSVCKSCREALSKRSGQPLIDDDPELGEKESNALKLSDIPTTASRAPPGEEDQIRSRLLQLEHERRMRPDDTHLLKEIGELYEKLGDRDEAARHKDEFLRLDPIEPQAEARAVVESKKPTARLKVLPRPGAAPFWEDIVGLLRFPIQGRVLPMTIGGGAASGMALTWARFHFLGYFPCILIAAYLWVYCIAVINSTVSGRKGPPQAPEFLNLWHSVLRPFLGAMASIAIPFAPFLLLLLVSLGLLGLGEVTGVLLMVTGLAGLFVAPMAFLRYALFDSVPQATRPRFLFDSIRKILADYLLFFAALCAVLAVGLLDVTLIAVIVRFLVPFPLVKTVFLFVGISLSCLYLGLVVSRTLGQLCAQSAGRLDWFGEVTVPEKPLTVPIMGIGAGGASLASLASLLVLLVLPPLLAGALGLGALPLQGGTYLSYDVYDSDGRRSSIRYDIHEVDEGFRFTATIVMPSGSAPFTDFTVDRKGLFVPGAPAQEGPIFVSMPGGAERRQTALCGPTWTDVGRHFVNDYRMTGKETWKGWSCHKVKNTDTGASHYYDRSTGYLVGVDLSDGLREHWAVLTETNVRGLRVPAATQRER